MSDNVTQWISAGFERLDYSFMTSTGIITGGLVNTVPANGAGIGLTQFTGVQSADPTIPEPTFIDIPGDDDVMGKFAFAPDTTPSFTLTHGVNQLTVGALTESTINVAYGPITLRALQPSGAVYKDVLLLFTRQAKEKGAGDGLSGYEHLVIYKSQLVTTSVPQAFEGRTGAVYRTSVSTTRSSKRPWGETLSDVTHGTTSEIMFQFFDSYKWTFFNFTGDGTATDVVLAKTPVTVARTLAKRFDTAAALTVSSVTPSTRTAVLNAAPTAALSCIFFHAYTD